MTWGRQTAALVSIAVMVASLSACSGADAESSETASTSAAGTPLPGVTDTTMTVGVVAADISAIAPRSTLDLRNEFRGLSAEQLAAFLPTSLTLGGRAVTVNATPFAPKNAIEAPDEPVQPICTAQKTSAVVITDVPNRSLIDCLIKNGSVVIDASATAWDTTALNERAPLLWASATAAADTAEKVLLAQAAERNALPQGKATVIKGPDEVSRRVADQITIPTLTSGGAQVATVDVPAAADATTFNEALSAIPFRSAPPQLVRPLAQRAYPVLAVRGPADGESAATSGDSQPPRYLVTSSDSLKFLPSSFPDVATVLSTAGIGWSPLSDATDAGPSTATAGEACAATYPGINFSDTATNAQSYLYRWCDAVDLLRIGAAPTGPLTDTAFRDAVWSNGQTWKPAAVFANGWTSNSYAGANQARWLTGNEACGPASGACFTYAEGPIPLT